MEVWKQQKFALCEQVHNMKYGSKCPSLHPSPLPFIFMDNDTSNISLNHLLILPSPFCLRNFDLAWDCKLASCRHAYHSWCLVSIEVEEEELTRASSKGKSKKSHEGDDHIIESPLKKKKKPTKTPIVQKLSISIKTRVAKVCVREIKGMYLN